MTEKTMALGVPDGHYYPEDTEAKTPEQASVEAYAGEPESEVAEMVAAASPYSFIRGLVDARYKIYRSRYGGPTERRPLSAKAGLIFHYAGPAQNRTVSALSRLNSYAVYHARPNAFGPGANGNGIMYHIGIAEDGTKYLLRDLEEDRWHCGAWPYNGTWIAVNIPIGEGQAPTAAQEKAALEVAEDWLKYKGLSRFYVKGHLEVGSSNCCGPTLMQRLVYRIRAGLGISGPQKAVKYYFAHGDSGSKKVAVAARDALVMAGLAPARIGAFGTPADSGRDGEKDIDWMGTAALEGELGEYPTTLVGKAVVGKLPVAVRNALKDDGGKWHPTTASDLWNATGEGGSVVDQAAWRVAEIATREKLNKVAAITAYDRAVGR